MNYQKKIMNYFTRYYILIFESFKNIIFIIKYKKKVNYLDKKKVKVFEQMPYL